MFGAGKIESSIFDALAETDSQAREMEFATAVARKEARILARHGIT